MENNFRYLKGKTLAGRVICPNRMSALDPVSSRDNGISAGAGQQLF